MSERTRADDTEAKLKLWFFRDLNDEQRQKLFRLLIPKIDSVMPMHQQTAFRGIIHQLRGE